VGVGRFVLDAKIGTPSVGCSKRTAGAMPFSGDMVGAPSATRSNVASSACGSRFQSSGSRISSAVEAPFESIDTSTRILPVGEVPYRLPSGSNRMLSLTESKPYLLNPL
jgi:hypothetical protein